MYDVELRWCDGYTTRWLVCPLFAQHLYEMVNVATESGIWLQSITLIPE